MPIVPKTVLKSYFQRADQPTEVQFATLIDSLVGVIDDRYLIGLREYDPTRQYLAGDTTIYNSAVYLCSVNTTGPFDPLAWKVIASLGSVTYVGTWDAINNVPILKSGLGTKGFYYVVSKASLIPSQNTTIDGINDWGVTDWIVFNGTKWEKVDNSTAPTKATEVSFNPSSELPYDNVQKAIEGSYGQTKTTLSKKIWVVDGDEGNIPLIDATGNLVDSLKTPDDFMPVDATAADLAFTPFSDITATNTQAAVEEVYTNALANVDDKADKIVPATDGNFAGLNATGNLIDTGRNSSSFLPNTTTATNIPFTPAGNISATNVQAAIAEVDTDKTDKIIPALAGNFAGLNGAGNLIDSGRNSSSFLASSTTATNIPFTPAGNISATNVQAAIAEVDTDKTDKIIPALAGNFAGLNGAGNLIDSGRNSSSFLASSTTATNIPFTPVGNISATNVQSAVAEVDTEKADKLIPAITGNFAGLSATGNLTDSGRNSTSFLSSSTTATNIPFTPTGGISATNVQAAIAEVDSEKMRTVPAAVNNRIAIFSSGSVVDSGKLISQYLATDNTTAYTPTASYHPATKLYVDSAIMKVVLVPFTFDSVAATSSASFARITSQVTIPQITDVFPGASVINARLVVDCMTANATAHGEVAIMVWNNAMSGTPTEVPGSIVTAPPSAGDWVVRRSGDFSIGGGRTYQVIFRRLAGPGSLQVEGATLILTYS